MATLPKPSPPPAAAVSLDQRFVRELAQRPAIANAERWFTRERQWLSEKHLELCRVPAATFFEQKRAAWFQAQLTAIGWDARLDRAGNVLAGFGEDTGGSLAIVSAHLDTVYAPARPEDVHYGADGRLIGPGTSDNGSGLTALLALARVLASDPDLHPLASSVILVANIGEEGEGNLSGMRYLCQHFATPERVQAILVLDGPSIEHITVQALASQRYEIVFSGPGGHSWNDHGMPNPVHALGMTIAAFVQQADIFSRESRRAAASYNFGIIEGGTSINSIPSSARAKLDIRSESAGLLTELSLLVSSTVERALELANRSARSGRLTAKVRDLGARPGGQLPADSPLLQAVRAVDSHLNIRSRVDCASTDANVPLSMGLPAISIGAGGQGGGAHTSNEWYQPDGREVGLRRILLVLAALHAQRAGQLPENHPTEIHHAEGGA